MFLREIVDFYVKLIYFSLKLINVSSVSTIQGHLVYVWIVGVSYVYRVPREYESRVPIFHEITVPIIFYVKLIDFKLK